MTTKHKLPNISLSKGNQTMKIVHLIEYNKKILCSKIVQKMRQRDWFQRHFCFLKKVYES